MCCQIVVSKGETDEPSMMSQFMLKWQNQKKNTPWSLVGYLSWHFQTDAHNYATQSYFIQRISYCVNSDTAGSSGCGTGLRSVQCKQLFLYSFSLFLWSSLKVTCTLTSKLLFVRISRSGRCCNTCAYISLVSKLWINCKVNKIKIKTSPSDWLN